ncbi:hypothetical protein RJ641_012523 [Dillenia turbinata]|uniref:F-box domain-containing protein n=1 Tax=Dillenia turbinata TaxID=194707 RepID=A0AAN8V296_9MAGN
MNMNFSKQMIENSPPDDIALEIASLLQVSDTCALGSCSRFWQELCSSECLWLCLCTRRWPSLGMEGNLHSETMKREEKFSIIRNVELCSTSLLCSSSSPNSLELRDY